jgi:hypothetical protein
VNDAVIRQYTIYAHPEDFPGIPFVVRGWSVCVHGELIPDGFVELCGTLDDARKAVPFDMVRVERHPTDPPTIVECWI